MFSHDSYHNCDHKMWEFETAYPKLQQGDLLASDETFWNDLFYDLLAG
jgi:hypothetical protein